MYVFYKSEVMKSKLEKQGIPVDPEKYFSTISKHPCLPWTYTVLFVSYISFLKLYFCVCVCVLYVVTYISLKLEEKILQI